MARPTRSDMSERRMRFEWPKRPLSGGLVSRFREMHSMLHKSQADKIDNTLILMQFAQSLGAEEAQIREMLGISELAVSRLSPACRADLVGDTWDDLPQ